MTIASISPDIKVEIIEIGSKMNQEGLAKRFIAEAVATGFEYEGVYDLLKMWSEETDEDERKEIVADIQELIEDCKQQPEQGLFVRFDDLDTISANIRAFKDGLRLEVDRQGGLTRLSELTDIPQPSLSRFFNSASRPRRSMLIRIARALKLSEIQLVELENTT